MNIYLEGHGPLQNYPKAKVGWEDVWVRYEKPPHKGPYWKHFTDEVRKGRWAPVLIGRADLRGDIWCNKEMLRKHRREPWIASVHLDLAENTTVDALLRHRDVVVGPSGASGETVWCRAETFGRAEAERMITAMLEQKLPEMELKRLRPFRFVWVKAETIVMPFSAGKAK